MTTGLGFPLAAVSGELRWLSGDASVRQSILAILLTEPGERIGRPNYGAGLEQFLFAPNTVESRTEIAQTVREAITRDEPRVALTEVSVYPDAEAPTLVHLRIRFRSTGSEGVIVARFSFDDGLLT